jgi:hypothetical protein
MKRRWVVVLSAVLLPLVGLRGDGVGGSAQAAEQQGRKPAIAAVEVGVGGRYKPGCWTQVKVAVRGVEKLAGGRITLTVPDGDGVPSRVSAPLPSPAPDGQATKTSGVTSAATSANSSAILYARFGRVKSEMAVELRSGDELVDRRVFNPGDGGYRPALSSEQELVITVGRGSPGVEDAVRLLQQPPERRTVVVEVEDFNELPEQWYGYEAVDAVVLSTSHPEIYAGLEPASPRMAALDRWVRLGGKLLLCAGEHAEEVLGGNGAAPLSQFVPGRPEQMVSLRRTNAFELYCGSSVQVPAKRREIRVPKLVDVDGRIEAADGALPLVIRRAHGLGQVVFVAADLDQPPLAEWQDRGLLAGKLLGYPPAPVDEDHEATAVMHLGFTDLAGQLRSALDQFPSVWVVPFWLVVGLVVLYVLAIGPGDYFFLRKLAGRMQLTWVTFPLIVAAFSVAGYVLAHRLKGDRVLVNQVDVVDVDAASGDVRGTAWADLFSPRMDRYDLAFRPQPSPALPTGNATTLTSWLGLAGDALGGMDPRAAEPARWDTYYEFSPALDSLRGVPIPTWSTKSLTARWTARSGPALKAQLVDEEMLLRGTVTNTLDVPLNDCILAYGIHAYELERLEPGETVEVGPRLKRRELKSWLTRRQLVFSKEKDDYRQQATPYDRASVDAAYILRLMMFFREAGGRGYAGLSNDHQGFVDLSHLVRTNRAVLVAWPESDPSAARPYGTELLCDGEPLPDGQVRRTAVYRFVFPVAFNSQHDPS